MPIKTLGVTLDSAFHSISKWSLTPHCDLVQVLFISYLEYSLKQIDQQGMIIIPNTDFGAEATASLEKFDPNIEEFMIFQHKWTVRKVISG